MQNKDKKDKKEEMRSTLKASSSGIFNAVKWE
jgi:hypothetical protein